MMRAFGRASEYNCFPSCMTISYLIGIRDAQLFFNWAIILYAYEASFAQCSVVITDLKRHRLVTDFKSDTVYLITIPPAASPSPPPTWLLIAAQSGYHVCGVSPLAVCVDVQLHGPAGPGRAGAEAVRQVQTTPPVLRGRRRRRHQSEGDGHVGAEVFKTGGRERYSNKCWYSIESHGGNPYVIQNNVILVRKSGLARQYRHRNMGNVSEKRAKPAERRAKTSCAENVPSLVSTEG